MNIENLIKKNQKILHELFSGNEELTFIRNEFLKYAGLKININNRPVIAAAHQPVFYYPGIMLKNYFISKTAKELNGIPINIIVDSDRAEVNIPVPYKKDSDYYIKNIKINNPEGYSFFNFLPSIRDVNLFFSEIEECIQSIDSNGIQKAFYNFKNSFFNLFTKNQNFIESIILLRREFERLSKFEVTDFKISEISKSLAFFQFVWYIIKNIENFLDIYNKAVGKNRKNNYQAVKFLFHEKNIYELPFWFVKDSLRYQIYLKKENNILSFFTTNENVDSILGIRRQIADSLASDPSCCNIITSIDIQNKNEIEIINLLKNNFMLSPKAITFTLMARIFLCDIFIHGTGGAIYDIITDEIIKFFFNLKSAPAYLSVTGDIYLPIINKDITDISNKYSEKQKWLQEVNHHPSKYMAKNLAKKYVEKKKKISIEFSVEKNLQKRKDTHKKLKNIDREMKDHFKAQIKLVKEELRRYEDILKNKDVFFERKYPYFLYPEKKRGQALTSMSNVKTRYPIADNFKEN